MTSWLTRHNITEHDEIFTRTLRHESEEIMEKLGKPFQINLFGGVAHGFAVRSDLSIPVDKYGKEESFWQATAWFDHYLEY
jgi:dienelactone hydrolase